MEKDFDVKILIPNVRRVIKEYDIKYDPEQPVPSDDSLADGLWKAALDLYLTVGTYCTSTHRRILFKEEEVKEAMAWLVDNITLGFGKDAQEWSSRRVEDGKRPTCFFSPVGVRCSEELFVPLVMAYISEPLADGVSTPILEEIEGRPVKSGAPSEIQGAAVHAMMVREAARRAGRPGMFILGTGSALTAAGQIATSSPDWGSRPTDMRLVPIISELKIDNDTLNKMLHFHQNGYMVGALSGPIYGAYTGVEGTAVIGVASHIQGLMVNQGYFTCYFPTDIKYFCNTTREMLWIVSVTCQALARNTRFITGSNGFAVAGPCTDMVLYEAAAHGLSSAVSGASILWEIAAASNKHKERTTPMEARMACETGIATTEMCMKRADANELVKQLLGKYEDKVEGAPIGKAFQECYDVARKRPTKEYTELYNRVKREIQDLGIEYLY